MRQYIYLLYYIILFIYLYSGVSHGSVLMPMLDSMYIKPLDTSTDSNSATHQSFSDDLQCLHLMTKYPRCLTVCSHVCK